MHNSKSMLVLQINIGHFTLIVITQLTFGQRVKLLRVVNLNCKLFLGFLFWCKNCCEYGVVNFYDYSSCAPKTDVCEIITIKIKFSAHRDR